MLCNALRCSAMLLETSSNHVTGPLETCAGGGGGKKMVTRDMALS